MTAAGALEGEWRRGWVGWGDEFEVAGRRTAALREHARHLAEVVARLNDADAGAGDLDEDLDPALLDEVHLAREVALADDDLARSVEDEAEHLRRRHAPGAR